MGLVTSVTVICQPNVTEIGDWLQQDKLYLGQHGCDEIPVYKIKVYQSESKVKTEK